MIKANLVLLPGWSKKGEDYQKLTDLLGEKYEVFALDLLDEKKVYCLADFANKVAGFLEEKKIIKPILVGHSFGGRVAIKLVISRPELVSKLILIDSAGIERKNWIIKSINSMKSINKVFFRIKSIKSDFFRNIFGSKDYLAARGNSRQTLINVVNENLEPELSKIKTPTLIIWGENDHTTPLWMGKVMAAQIQGATLTVMPGDHGLPYRRAKEVAETILGAARMTND